MHSRTFCKSIIVQCGTLSFTITYWSQRWRELPQRVQREPRYNSIIMYILSLSCVSITTSCVPETCMSCYTFVAQHVVSTNRLYHRYAWIYGDVTSKHNNLTRFASQRPVSYSALLPKLLLDFSLPRCTTVGQWFTDTSH